MPYKFKCKTNVFTIEELKPKTKSGRKHVDAAGTSTVFPCSTRFDVAKMERKVRTANNIASRNREQPVFYVPNPYTSQSIEPLGSERENRDENAPNSDFVSGPFLYLGRHYFDRPLPGAKKEAKKEAKRGAKVPNKKGAKKEAKKGSKKK